MKNIYRLILAVSIGTLCGLAAQAQDTWYGTNAGANPQMGGNTCYL